METGVPGTNRRQDGWINRLLVEANNRSPLQAISIGSTRQAGNRQMIDRKMVVPITATAIRCG
jgi:hypothetical protein